MDWFESRYFCIPKALQISVGLWPYHPGKKFWRTFWLSLVVITTSPQAIGLVINHHDVGKLMEHIVLCLVSLAMFTKLYTLLSAEPKSKIVYSGIVDNWTMIVDCEEKNILIRYSETARMINIIYLTMQSSVYVCFVFLPLLPVILNQIHPLAVPRAYVYVLHGEYLVENKDAHYAFIYLWETVATTCILALGAPIDSTHTATVQHLLGLFAIIEHRLLNLKHAVADSLVGTREATYNHMVEIVKLHQRALTFANTIEQQYSLCFFVLICLQIVLFPLICNLVLMSLENPLNICRYAMFAICVMAHLFNMMWPGQKLIDQSDRVFEAAYCNDWYTCSIETRKILRLFMLRSLSPTVLTAGGLTILNFANFFAIVKTALSYVTVFASFR